MGFAPWSVAGENVCEISLLLISIVFAFLFGGGMDLGKELKKAFQWDMNVSACVPTLFPAFCRSPAV